MAPATRYENYRSAAATLATGWTRVVIHEPGRLYGSNGIRLGPDGLVWITEFYGEHVTAWSPETDAVTVVSPMGSDLEGPDDLAFDRAQTMYVTETMNGRVTARTAAGDVFVVLDDCPAANGITIDPRTDVLYVDEMREGGRLLKVDKAQRNEFHTLVDGLHWSNALEVGPDGFLYLPQVFDAKVLVVDAETGDIRRSIEGFECPTAVKFDPDGRLVVSEAGSGRITLVSDDGRRTLAQTDPGIDNFCFAPDGSLFVSSFIDPRVEQWEAVASAPVHVLGSNVLAGPYGLNFAEDGQSLLVADANSVARVTLDGRIERLSRLLLGQDFVAVDVVDAGEGFAVLTLAGDVLLVAHDGTVKEKVVSATSELTDQYLSTAARGASALGQDGLTLLVGTREGEVLEFDFGGARIGSVNTGLAQVTAVDRRDGVLAAADSEKGSVLLFTESERKEFSGFDRPDAVGVSGRDVYLIETGKRRLVAVSIDSGVVHTVAKDLPVGMPVARVKSGRSPSIAIDRDGSVVLGCDGDGSILRFRH
jgi:sugar lactone lactonase YvrE